MKKCRSVFFSFSALMVFFCVCLTVQAQDEYPVWPDKAPGVTEETPDAKNRGGAFSRVTKPTIRVFVPKNKTSDAQLQASSLRH